MVKRVLGVLRVAKALISCRSMKRCSLLAVQVVLLVLGWLERRNVEDL